MADSDVPFSTDSRTLGTLRKLYVRTLELLDEAFILLVVILLVSAGFYYFVSRHAPAVDIVVDAENANGQWELQGRVVNDDKPIPGGTRVWAIATSKNGNRYSPSAVVIDGSGRFELRGIPATLGGASVAEISVFAADPAKTIRGKETLRTDGSDGEKKSTRVNVPRDELLALTLVFMICLIIPFRRQPPGYYSYVLALLLACLFTGLMIFSLASGLYKIAANGDENRVYNWGFASLSYDTFVREGGRQEWLFSLTPPRRIEAGKAGQSAPSNAQSAGVRGFGAPLWVLLLAVIGSGITTVSLVVGEIDRRPANEEEYREAIQRVMRHQYFVFFAPIGAMFIYQILVAVNAAGYELTVAIAAIGSGIALNSLLNTAIRYVRRLIGSEEKLLPQARAAAAVGQD